MACQSRTPAPPLHPPKKGTNENEEAYKLRKHDGRSKKGRQKERKIERKDDRKERKKPTESKEGTTVSECKKREKKSVATSVRLYSQSSVTVKPLAAG